MEKEMEREDVASTPNATEEGPDVAGGLPEPAGSRGTGREPQPEVPGLQEHERGVGHVWHMDEMGLVLQVASVTPCAS